MLLLALILVSALTACDSGRTSGETTTTVAVGAASVANASVPRLIVPLDLATCRDVAASLEAERVESICTAGTTSVFAQYAFATPTCPVDQGGSLRLTRTEGVDVPDALFVVDIPTTDGCDDPVRELAVAIVSPGLDLPPSGVLARLAVDGEVYGPPFLLVQESDGSALIPVPVPETVDEAAG